MCGRNNSSSVVVLNPIFGRSMGCDMGGREQRFSPGQLSSLRQGFLSVLSFCYVSMTPRPAAATLFSASHPSIISSVVIVFLLLSLHSSTTTPLLHHSLTSYTQDFQLAGAGLSSRAQLPVLALRRHVEGKTCSCARFSLCHTRAQSWSP
jgi:hypothetical protein